MNTWVSLLRGINVGTTKQVKMEDLVPVYESLEMVNIRTYLRSGNVVFDSPERDPVKLSAILEDEITRTSGFPVKVLMRNREELGRLSEATRIYPGTLVIPQGSMLPSCLIILHQTGSMKLVR